MSIFQNRTVAITAGATIIAVAGSTGAVAANLVNSADIRDNSIRSVDVRDGSMRMGDLRPRVVAKFTKDSDSTFDDSELEEQIADLQARVVALEGADASGVNRNWVANPGSEIVDADTLRLTGPEPTSVEIQNLDLDVDATKTLSVTYELTDGAVYAASFRAFIFVNGEQVNTNDSSPADAGIDNGDGTFTKTVTIGKNGKVGYAGVVYDGGHAGTVIVHDLKVSGHDVKFQ